MIELQHVNKIYDGGEYRVHALQGVNLFIAAGEHVVITGRSGSGKSTFLNIISGIDRPTSGTVIVHNADLNQLAENELSHWRGQHIGIVFQFYQLLPTLSARDNVLFAMSLVDKIPRKDRIKKADSLLEAVGLADKGRKFPNELSGGERQRVAIARSLANDPALIIADEPSGNLDSQTGEQIHRLFQEVNAKGTTMITVTHASLHGRTYDRILHMEDGVLTELRPSATEK